MAFFFCLWGNERPLPALPLGQLQGLDRTAMGGAALSASTLHAGGASAASPHGLLEGKNVLLGVTAFAQTLQKIHIYTYEYIIITSVLEKVLNEQRIYSTAIFGCIDMHCFINRRSRKAVYEFLVLCTTSVILLK